MILPHVRFTVRRLMVAVAVCGLLAALIFEGERRRGRFRLEVEKFSRLASEDFLRGAFLHNVAGLGPTPSEVRLRGFHERRTAYYQAMGEKYARAVSRPWFPVWPDPPEPE